MPTPQANVAQLTFETAALDPATFQVVDFVGEEYLSQPFRFEIHLVSEDPEIDFADVVAQPGTLHLQRGQDTVPVHGMVADFQQGGHTADRFGYRALLVPRIWGLSLNHQSRIFQNKTVEDIIRDVLTEGGFSSDDFRFDLKGAYAPREYCVQYRETDLNFLGRLLEHEGIQYFFEHEDRDVLVMTDDRSGNPRIPGDDAIGYNVGGGLVPATEAVREFVCRERIVTGKVQLKDYNYRTDQTNLMAESQLNSQMDGVFSEYGEHFKEQKEGDRLAKVRNEELECQRRVLYGEGSSAGLRSGHVFTLEKHYRADLNGDYLITHVRHIGSQGAALPGLSQMQTDETEVYRNEFTCIPADVPFRPPRITPVPQVTGILTAKVETAGGDYPYIDEEGCYRAKLHFDLSSQTNGTASRPIRLSQPFSGAGYGLHFPNHAGTEMVVSFIDGNVDRPLALGTVPNPSNASPAKAKNNMQNILRTKAGSQLIMDDTIDKAYVLVETPDANQMKLDDENDQILIQTTNKHTITLDDKNERLEVKTKDGHFLLLDDKNKKITLQSKDGHFITVNDQDKVMTLADKDKKNTFTIDIGNKKLVIKTDEGSIDLHAPKGTIDVKAKALNIETTGDTKLKAANINTEAQSDHKMKAMNVTAEATMDFKQKGMNVTSEASMNHGIKGLQVKSEGSVQNDVAGALVNVKASGINTIQGALVKIN